VFESSHPLGFFDYFRVPYDVSPGTAALPGCGRLHRRGLRSGTPALHWLRGPAGAASDGVRAPDRFWVEGVPGHGCLVPDGVAAAWLRAGATTWRPAFAVRDGAGRAVASVWRDEDGSVFLPFDPDEVMTNFWSERYRQTSRGGLRRAGRHVAVHTYYQVRPALPRPVQIGMRRMLAPLQARSRFPRWPLEPGLHDLYTFLSAVVAGVAGEPVPCIAPWPDGCSWALVLTHDVETRAGHDAVGRLREIEADLGYRSSWNFVPARYTVDGPLLDELAADGCEVGVHGLHHDGRDLASAAELARRLPAIRRYAEAWNAVGFRSPATQRVWEWMPLLGFDYDSSYPDTDPFEPQPGGCCSLLPFFNAGLVELPITLPQDHTLFAILGHPDAGVWISKTAAVRDRAGMALLITHPDYASGTPLLPAYRRFLGLHRDDPDAWRTLPREVADWWRRRAASRLEPDDGDWRVVGPAAGRATVGFMPTLVREEHR